MADGGIATALLITAASAAASAGTAAYAAQRQNRAIRKSQESTQRAATVQSSQVRQAASLERQKEINRAQIVRARIRTAAAEAGFEDAGTYLELQKQATQDAALNVGIIRRNQQAQLDRIASGLDATLTDLSARVMSPVLSAFSGGLEGAQQGMAIYGGLNSAGAFSSAAPAAPPPSTYAVGQAGGYGNYTGSGGRIA